MPGSPTMPASFDRLLPHANSQPWGSLSAGLVLLSGAIRGLNAVGLNLGGSAGGASVPPMAAQLQSLPAPLPLPPMPAGIDINALGTLVGTLAAIDLLRRQMSIDLLQPDWQPRLQRAAGAMAQLHAKAPASGMSVTQADLAALSAMRTTLVSTTGLRNALGFSLRAPEAQARLQGTLQSLQGAGSTGAASVAPTPSEESVLRRLLNELSRLSASLLSPAIAPV
jgi:hypothetical protein